MTTWISGLEALPQILTAWMLTYLLHSSVILGSACLLWKWLPGTALPVKELFLKLGLVGGILTASLQIGLGLQPLGGSWELPSTTAPSSPVAQVTGAIRAPLPTQTLGPGAIAGSTVSARKVSMGASEPPLEASGTTAWGRRTATLSIWLSLAWLLGAGILTAGLLISYLRLDALLTDRQHLDRGPLFELLQRLMRLTDVRSSVGLSSSPRISIPMARGLLRGEICMPRRAIHELPSEHHEIILAHELAHLERRDPSWLLLARTIESLLFFQPLNRKARKLLQEVAEFRCDDWAVQQTGRPITMARVLTELAEISLRSRGAHLVPAMASDRSGLGRRITRLVDRDYPRPENPVSRWMPIGATITLAVLVIVAPGFSIGDSAAQDPSAAPMVPPVADVTPTSEAPALPPDASLADLTAAAIPPNPPAPELPSSEPIPVVPPIERFPLFEADLESAVEVAIEPMILDIEASLQVAMTALNEELEVHLEPIQEELALQLEVLQETLQPELEAMAHELSQLAVDLHPSEEAMAELEEQARLLAETALPTAEQMERLRQEARNLADSWPSEEEIEQLRESARQMAESARPSEAELARLREQAQELAKSVRLDEESLAELRDRARALSEQARPSQEQFELLQDRLRETMEEWRAQHLRYLEEREESESPEPPEQ